MRARIVHRLNYRYDAAVSLGEHRLCLKPRGQGFQQLLEHQLTVLPQPQQRRELLAASGDEIQRLSFIGSTDRLSFEASSLVETRPAPPLSLCFNGMEPPLPYPRGRLNGDLLGALEGWLPNGQHEPSAIDLTQEALMGSYFASLAIGLLIASGSIGLLFPPSLPVILYGVVAQVPIDKLYIAGIVPGMVLVGLLVLWWLTF